MIDVYADASLALSAALAIVWTWWGEGFGAEAKEDSGDGSEQVAWWGSGVLGRLVMYAAGQIWGIVTALCAPQLVPGLLLLYAGSSPRAVLGAALSFDISDGYKPTGEAPGWMGPDPDRAQRIALAGALAVWRAEKLDSFMKRIQRTAQDVRRQGAADFLSCCVRDPWGFARPEVWGLVRRAALAALGTIGSVPFLRMAFPACVLDECLKYVLTTAVDVWERRVARHFSSLSVPMFVNLLLLPIIDMLHCGLMSIKMLLLGVLTYPLYDAPGVNSGFLVTCTILASIHNYGCLDSVIRPLPEFAELMWQAMRGQG